MPIVSNNKTRRNYRKTPLTLLTTAALVFLAGMPLSAQGATQNPRLYNPNTPWSVTDKATALNPVCLLQRSYNPNIKVRISSDITGKAHINIANIPPADAKITGLSFDGTPITNLSASDNTQINATLNHADTDLAPLYSGEFIVISYDGAAALKLPIQSTAVAEARMSLCVSVIDEFKSFNAEKANTIDLDTMKAEAQAFAADTPIEIAAGIQNEEPPQELVDILTPPEYTSPTQENVTSDTLVELADADEDDALAKLIDEVSTPQPEEIDAVEQSIAAASAIAEPTLEAAADAVAAGSVSEEMTPSAETPIEIAQDDIDPMMDIEALIDESLPLAQGSPAQDYEDAAYADDILVADAPVESQPLEPTPPAMDDAQSDEVEDISLDDAALDIEDDVTGALENSLAQAPDDAVEDFAAETSSISAKDLASDGEIMDDNDILNALTQNINAEPELPSATAASDIDTAADVPLDALITMDDTMAQANSDTAEVTEKDTLTPMAESGEADSVNAEISDDIDQAILETLSADDAASTQQDKETETVLADSLTTDTLFDDTLSLELDDDGATSENDDENIVDELSNEDFSDQELLALLDDPDALSDDFAEVMIEEEFEQIKPMEGVRKMLGLGTPDDIEYRKVPWLIEEDIDSQWKEKVKLLEREKEMLRLRLADTTANPIADLISRKRNRRTQEELVDKIKALEAENMKLKKGLMLSDNPEEFLADDLKISDPKSAMRMGKAQPSKIDLISEDIDNDLDSLETRMDSFLKGVGEDYALANGKDASPLASASLTQDIINILKAGYVVDPDALKIRAYRHKSTGTAVTAWEAGDLQGRAERSVLPPNADFTAYVERFLNAAQLRCNGNFTAVPDTSTRNLKTLDIHCNDGAIGQRSSVIFIKHGSIITAIATTTNLPKGGSDFLRDIRKRIIEGIRIMDRKKT